MWLRLRKTVARSRPVGALLAISKTAAIIDGNVVAIQARNRSDSESITAHVTRFFRAGAQLQDVCVPPPHWRADIPRRSEPAVSQLRQPYSGARIHRCRRRNCRGSSAPRTAASEGVPFRTDTRLYLERRAGAHRCNARGGRLLRGPAR